MIGGIAETQEMLEFCAEHQIGADIEVIRADQVNEAYERVLASDVRYPLRHRCPHPRLRPPLEDATDRYSPSAPGGDARSMPADS
jgi:hypothetical protein